MEDLQSLRVEVEGDVGVVTLARPPVNAVTQPMYDEIRRVFTLPDTYLPGARVIILAGAGKHFCGGNDLTEFQTLSPVNSINRMKRIREAFWAIYDSPAPVVAAVHGVALGTGLALAGSCDLVVAAEGAEFGLPEVAVGIMGGAKHASRLVPQAMVRYMHLTGAPVAAEELVRYGGILKVVPRDELMAQARSIANEMAQHSPVSLRFAKQSLNAIEYRDLKSGYEYEQSLSGELSSYSDAKEAVSAFFERRRPQYTGS